MSRRKSCQGSFSSSEKARQTMLAGSFPGLSPEHLQPKLVDAAGPSVRNLPVLVRTGVMVRSAPLGVVPRIERLHAELYGRPLGNREVLEQRQVPVVYAGCTQNVAAAIAEKCLRRRPECIGVEPLCNGGVKAAGIRITDKVGSVRSETIEETP